MPNSEFSNYYDSSNLAVGPSPALWQRYVPLSGALSGLGFYHYDDFANAGGPVTSNVGGWAGYKSFEDNSCSLAVRDAFPRALRFATTTTDNIEVNLQGAYSAGSQVRITDTAADAKVVIFEASVAVGQISNTYNAFVGLAEPALAANDGFFSDAAAIADKDYIGFYIGEADGDKWSFGYNLAGQTDVIKIASVAVPVAATFAKLGFVYDPLAEDAKKIAVFVDGVEQTTYVTATNIATATGSAFPDAQGLSMFASLKNGENVAKTMDLKFWAAYMGA